MELFSLLVVIICIAGLIFWRRAINRVATYTEDMVKMGTREASTDFEERTLIVQQRLEALDKEHPNRTRFADLDSLFESTKGKATKSKNS